MNKKIRILLVDDHALFRAGIKYLLEHHECFDVVGEAVDGLEGIKLVQQLKPDLVLLDLDMPRMNGREALLQLLNMYPDLVVLILTVSEDVDDLAECMQIGARGYLLKNIDYNFLLDAIKKSVEGDNVLSPEMTAKLIERIRLPIIANEDGLDNLTPREMDILRCLARGLSNKSIALKFNLSESTIKVHVQNILRKLDLRSRVQIAIFAVQRGLE